MHAVLAWLVLETDLPVVVHGHLVDALGPWSPLMGEHLFPTGPGGGVAADRYQVLEGLWWCLDAQADEARWVARVVRDEARGRIGLARRALRRDRAVALRLPRPRSSGA